MWYGLSIDSRDPQVWGSYSEALADLDNDELLSLRRFRTAFDAKRATYDGEEVESCDSDSDCSLDGGTSMAGVLAGDSLSRILSSSSGAVRGVAQGAKFLPGEPGSKYRKIGDSTSSEALLERTSGFNDPASGPLSSVMSASGYSGPLGAHPASTHVGLPLKSEPIRLDLAVGYESPPPGVPSHSGPRMLSALKKFRPRVSHTSRALPSTSSNRGRVRNEEAMEAQSAASAPRLHAAPMFSIVPHLSESYRLASRPVTTGIEAVHQRGREVGFLRERGMSAWWSDSSSLGHQLVCTRAAFPAFHSALDSYRSHCRWEDETLVGQIEVCFSDSRPGAVKGRQGAGLRIGAGHPLNAALSLPRCKSANRCYIHALRRFLEVASMLGHDDGPLLVETSSEYVVNVLNDSSECRANVDLWGPLFPVLHRMRVSGRALGVIAKDPEVVSLANLGALRSISYVVEGGRAPPN